MTLEQRFLGVAGELACVRQDYAALQQQAVEMNEACEKQAARIDEARACLLALLGAFGNQHPNGTPETDCEDRARKWLEEEV
jgi:hypothetical protein